MFTTDQIKTAHSKVKSGADFPAYISEIKKCGVESYDTFVVDGHTDFGGNNGYKISAEPKYERLSVADQSNIETFTKQLKEHQQGQSDYPTFCGQAAQNGVEKWTVDLKAMTCNYYDKSGNLMLSENIPS